MNSNSEVERRWELQTPPDDVVDGLARKLGLPAPLAKVLANRGIIEHGAVKKFLKPSLKNLEPPAGLKDLDIAVERLRRALERNETIAVYGDYDVDGITATAMLANFLRLLKAKVITHTPDRFSEGYGLHVSSLEKLKSQGAKVVVSVDLGIADAEEARWAGENGMDVIILDHHQLPEQLPEAAAVVDPFRSDDERYRVLSGAGLAFYLEMAMRRKMRDDGAFKDGGEPNLRADLDLAALGTIADLAPLTGPNRIIAHFGLKELGAERRPGVAALKKVSGMSRKNVTSGQVAFQLAPRVNAAGRMGKADRAVRLFSTGEEQSAIEIARELDGLNRQRRELEARILAEAFEIIEEDGLHKGNAVVVAGKGWHPGVIGIVANKITDRYRLPSVVIALDGAKSKGSARSVKGLHLYRAMKDCRDSLVTFGGHKMAAGIVIEESRVAAFRERFDEVVGLADPPLRQYILKIDAELDLEDLDGVLAESLGALKPHGMGNPEPVFLSRNVKALEPKKVGAAHLRFRAPAAEGPIEAIAFGRCDALEMARERPLDIAYTPRLTNWEGWKRLEIKVRDLRPVDESP